MLQTAVLREKPQHGCFDGKAPGFVIARRPKADVAISQNTAGSQGTPGEYGNFTRRGVEDAAPYKECVVGDNTRKFVAAKGTP